jgi:hypothetical protein
MAAGCYEIIGLGANRVSVPHSTRRPKLLDPDAEGADRCAFSRCGQRVAFLHLVMAPAGEWALSGFEC